MIKTNKGFTLLELLVVVLILGILAAMALPQYFKAVERSRMAEAETLMNSISMAQRRKFMQINAYADDFRGLDVSPQESTGRLYHTKGDPLTGANGNGFFIELGGTAFPVGGIQATREHNGNALSSSLQYQYRLLRYYQSDDVTCLGTNQAGRELCADYCGIDTPVRICCNNGTGDWCPDPTNN